MNLFILRIFKNFNIPKKKILLTIDDAFQFLQSGMAFLKDNKIPFILFVSTVSVGNNGYMNWDQIKKLINKAAIIGHHSHSHEYLIDKRIKILLKI